MAKSSNSKPGPKASSKKSTMSSATDKLSELAQNPVARSMLAAGLVAAAAALSTNEKVRQGAKKAGRDALDGAEAAADNASKIGAAIVTAATETVRRLMAGASRSGSGGAAKSRSNSAKSGSTRTGAAAKPKTAARSKTAAKPKAKTARKPAAKSSASAGRTKSASSPAKPRSAAKRKPAGAAKPRGSAGAKAGGKTGGPSGAPAS